MTAAAHPGPTVLVVDDDFIVLSIVETMLAKAGLRVHTASSGESALTLLRDKGQAIDWLFTDINLPGLVDGWSVADEYRLSYPTRPIIYASAGPRKDRRTVPGSIFVQKPIDPAEILRLAEMMQAAAEPRAAA